MNLQDIQILLNGPQGWLLMGGGILLLLVCLVYRRLGKLAVATRNDLAELHDVMTKLADRLDKASDLLSSASAAIYDGESVPTMAEFDTDEALHESVDDSYVYETSPAPEDDVALPDAGEEATACAESQPSEDLQVGAGTADEASLVSMEDTDLAEFGEEPAGDDDSVLSDDLQAVADTLDEPFDDVYGYEVPSVADSDAESNQAGVLLAMEIDGGLSDAPETAVEAFGEFQFGSPVLPGETGDVCSVDVEQCASDAQQTVFESSEQTESFVFGAELPLSDREEVEAAQSEPLEELAAVQPPSIDDLETSGAVPPEPEVVSTVDSQPASKIPTLESLPGHPDRPQVGVARCGECGRKIAYPIRLAGKRMRCPACRTTSILP